MEHISFFPIAITGNKYMMRDHWACDSTMRQVLHFLGAKKLKTGEPSDNITIIDKITEYLNKFGYIGVMLENGGVNDADDDVFAHCFVIWIKDSRIYRIESYIETYPFRIVEWENYKEDLINLMSLPINERLTKWNEFFNCDEPQDSKRKLYASIIASS